MMPGRAVSAGGRAAATGGETEEVGDARETAKAHPVWAALAKQAGDAFVLQWCFLRNRGRWGRGRMPRRFMWARPVERPRCGRGTRLAGPERFAAQAAAASDVLAFYELYVAIRRRLSGRAEVLDLCCGGGGQSQGVSRMGGVPRGIDVEERFINSSLLREWK